MFDPHEWNREVRGGMVASAIITVTATIGAALLVAAVFIWWPWR